MNPVGVVVILKLPQLFFQIVPIPKKSLVQKLPPDGADKPLGEGVRYRSCAPQKVDPVQIK